jgi:hypothetical protein
MLLYMAMSPNALNAQLSHEFQTALPWEHSGAGVGGGGVGGGVGHGGHAGQHFGHSGHFWAGFFPLPGAAWINVDDNKSRKTKIFFTVIFSQLNCVGKLYRYFVI